MMKCVMDQFVDEVKDFSSQYGSSGSISYVADNLSGGISLFPDYGDFSGSYSMQTYGKWWKISSSAPPYVPDPCPLMKPAIDFVDLLYETSVHPIRVDIYEIYNPGSVVRVWGSQKGKEWILLWSGAPSHQPAQSRIFSPPVIQPDEFINMLRLEFDQSIHDYNCGFEAVLLVGSTHVSTPENFRPHSISYLLRKRGIGENELEFSEESIKAVAKYLLSDKLKSMNFSSISSGEISDSEEEEAAYREVLREEKAEVNEKSKSPLHCSLQSPLRSEEEVEGGYFAMLPEELIIHIMKLIDIQSLCRLACTCKAMNILSSCPLFYQNLNLKNCWWLIKESTFSWLSQKCIYLKSLDLSWCGAYDRISSQSFMEFINQCGHNLSILHLSNCHFVDSYCLYIIANTCSKLEALSLSACCKVDHLGFGELKKLTKLKFLDLSRTGIEFGILQILLQSVDQLNHLHLHHCTALDLDKVAQTLGRFNRSLISLGVWKTRGLTSRGLKSLASLNLLEELDLGWAFDRQSGPITEGLGELLRESPGLKKLFVTAFRGLTDEDVDLLSIYGKSLEQVDVMGSRNISPEAILRLLERCEKLQLLDVSYCEQIHSAYVQHWKIQFPDVSIKGGQKNHVSLS